MDQDTVVTECDKVMMRWVVTLTIWPVKMGLGVALFGKQWE